MLDTSRTAPTESDTKDMSYETGISLRTSGQNFGQALQIPGKLAFWHGYPAQTPMKKASV